MESRCLAEADPQGRSRQSHQIGRVAALKCGMLWTQGLPTKHLGKFKNTDFTILLSQTVLGERTLHIRKQGLVKFHILSIDNTLFFNKLANQSALRDIEVHQILHHWS